MVQKHHHWQIGLLLVSLLRMVLHANWSLFFASVAVAWIVAALLFRMIVDER